MSNAAATTELSHDDAYRRRALRTIHFIYAGLGALLLAYALGMSWYSWSSHRAGYVDQLGTIIDLEAKAVNEYFLRLQWSSDAAARRLGTETNGLSAERAGPLLDAVLDAHRELTNALVIGLDGRILFASRVPSLPPGHSLRDEPSFRRFMAEFEGGRVAVIGQPVVGIASRIPIIPYRQVVNDAAGRPRAVLNLSIPLSYLQSFWEQAPITRFAAIGLMRDDGYLVSRYPMPANGEMSEIFGQPRRGTLYNHLVANAYPQRGEALGPTSWDAAQFLIVFHRLDDYPLTMFASYPMARVYATWWESMRGVYALLVLVAAGLVSAYRASLRRQRSLMQAQADLERSIAERHDVIEEELHRRVVERTAALEAANAELESFSYTVAHDMRAPVRAINGFSEMALQRSAGRLDPTATDYLQRVIAASRHMGRLIDDLLALARLSRQEMHKTDFNLAECAARAVETLRAAEPQRRVAVNIAPDLPVHADPALMAVVMDNLVGNAWKYSAKVDIARIIVGTTVSDDGICYFVRDNGAGFDMQYAHKLFKPFQRLHHADEFEGTGIGLATVRKIIQRHGGRVWIESAPGAGTTVSFTIGAR